MATITIQYDARNATFGKIIDVLTSMGAKIVTPTTKKTTEKVNVPNATTLKAMRDADNGKVRHYASATDLINEMYAL